MQRAADRLSASGSARAIDMLIISLKKVISQPHNERFRTLDPKTAAMQLIADAHGGIEMLWACGWEPIHGHLVLQYHDPDRLQRALAELERVCGDATYKSAKQSLQSANAKEAALKAQAQSDAAARNALAAKVPNEPEEGEAGACLLCFHFSKQGQTVWRRFESCNTREDMLNYVRSLPLVNPNAPITLKNVTTAPRTLLTDSLTGRTLQSLDLWPSGHIEVCCLA